MRILQDQPIRRQVVTATCLLLIPLAIAVAWSGNRTQRERESEVEAQAVTIADTAAAYLSLYLTGVDSVASTLVHHPAVVALDRAECNRLFADVLRGEPLLLNVLVTDVDGVVKGSGINQPEALTTVTRPYVKQVVALGKPVVTDLSTGSVSRKPTIILAYPVPSADGSVRGVLAVGLNLINLQALFASMPLPEESVVTLTDSQSRVISRSREAERYVGTALNPNPMPPTAVAPMRVETGPDGITRFYGNAVVARGPWLLSVGIPRSVALARIAGFWRRNLAIVVSAIASILLLASWLANELSRDLNRLRSAAQRIAEGDLSTPRKMRVANLEFAQLQDAFITMAANLRAMRDTLDHQVEQERKVREMVQSLQRQVVRQERLTAVGLLVSGVAHELNNPLQAILGTAELLERDPELTDSAREEIAFVKVQSGRAREIIRNLSRFSSQQSGPPVVLDLRDVIAEVIQLRRRDLEVASISLDVETSSSRKVFANFTELEQVVLNFVINAQQSIESTGRGNGRILIRLYDIGKKVCLEVWDDGPGVSTADEPKLFQPFFTTKPVGKGTGLGLSVSYGIIDAYGGTIGYRDNEWRGAIFFFELPVSDQQTPVSTDTSSASSQAHDRPAVLQRPLSPRV